MFALLQSVALAHLWYATCDMHRLVHACVASVMCAGRLAASVSETCGKVTSRLQTGFVTGPKRRETFESFIRSLNGLVIVWACVCASQPDGSQWAFVVRFAPATDSVPLFVCVCPCGRNGASFIINVHRVA